MYKSLTIGFYYNNVYNLRLVKFVTAKMEKGKLRELYGMVDLDRADPDKEKLPSDEMRGSLYSLVKEYRDSKDFGWHFYSRTVDLLEILEDAPRSIKNLGIDDNFLSYLKSVEKALNPGTKLPGSEYELFGTEDGAGLCRSAANVQLSYLSDAYVDPQLWFDFANEHLVKRGSE